MENAKFVLSTIHSAKGLEFDNVLVVYENESESSIDEATKRMYYVAFTRAKKAEFIFAYDTMAYPKICGDYEKIVKDLDAQAQAVANGTGAAGTDADDNDDTTVVPNQLGPMDTGIATTDVVTANTAATDDTKDNTVPTEN